jgi:hypothetical protein
MDAGKTKIPVGTRIEITHITDFEDKEFIGKTGVIVQPFGSLMGNELCGVELDDKTIFAGDIINLLDGDKFKVIGSGILITEKGHRFVDAIHDFDNCPACQKAQ